MKQIAITLVHNKGDKGNSAQIEELKNLLVLKEDLHDELNEKGEVIGQYTTYHQEFIGIDTPHEVKVYQAIPYGVEPPPNRYDINTGGIVEYRAGDEDKTGDHPRFFNWGAKRGIDQGAELSIYLENVPKLTAQIAAVVLAEKADFAVEEFGKVISKEEFVREQLKEDKELSEAVSERELKVEARRGR